MTVYLEIDWSEQKHPLRLMNEAGAGIQQMSVEHQLLGQKIVQVVQDVAGKI